MSQSANLCNSFATSRLCSGGQFSASSFKWSSIHLSRFHFAHAEGANLTHLSCGTAKHRSPSTPGRADRRAPRSVVTSNSRFSAHTLRKSFSRSIIPRGVWNATLFVANFVRACAPLSRWRAIAWQMHRSYLQQVSFVFSSTRQRASAAPDPFEEPIYFSRQTVCPVTWTSAVHVNNSTVLLTTF